MTYTLVTDGSFDQVLIPILTWSLKRIGVEVISSQWADLRRLAAGPRDFRERLVISLDLYPCDLLFIHRDAERLPYQDRLDEIEEAVQTAEMLAPPSVPVIPVRMTEAWLLGSVSAIRSAAGNPRGREPIDLPRGSEVERLPDPKATLRDLILAAAGLNARRRSHLSLAERCHRVVDFIDDFSYLEDLSAFQEFYRRLETQVRVLGLAPS